MLAWHFASTSKSMCFFALMHGGHGYWVFSKHNRDAHSTFTVTQQSSQSSWGSVNFTMTMSDCGFPTKAVFWPTYETSTVRHKSDEQTMAGSDKDKQRIYLIRYVHTKFCKFPPEIFLPEKPLKIHRRKRFTLFRFNNRFNTVLLQSN